MVYTWMLLSDSSLSKIHKLSSMTDGAVIANRGCVMQIGGAAAGGGDYFLVFSPSNLIILRIKRVVK